MRAVVVLAAGKGKRMRSDLPKVLHPLLGIPLLEYPLELVEALGIDHKAVVVGHGSDLVKETFGGRGRKTGDGSIIWAVQEEQLGTGHAAYVGLQALLASLKTNPESLNVVVLNGDLPLLRPATVARLIESHEDGPEEDRAEVTLLSCRKSDPAGFGRIVREPAAGGDFVSGDFVSIIEESDADAATLAVREVNVGTYVFRASTLLEFYQKTSTENQQGEFYLTDVVVEAAKQGRRVKTVSVRDESETVQINSRTELSRASEVLRQSLLEEHMDAGVTIDDPASTYIEKGVRIGKDAHIHPFVAIYAGVDIGRDAHVHPFTVLRGGVTIGSGCEVGPHAHLRPGTELDEGASVGNFVEVKNSFLGKGTKARHLSYIGDGIVGRKVNIGAGTIFANYDGELKHTTVVKDKAFIGSGTVLVAPVTVGEGAITGAGSVVLRHHDVGDGEVVVGVPARKLTKKKGLAE